MDEKKLCIFTLSLLLSFSASSSISDFDALLSFKLSADPSNSLSSWSNSSHPCSWLGVTCKTRHNNTVIKLVLENLNLIGSIEPLTHLKHLRLLSLKNNSLSSSSLDFSTWKSLKLLYLSHNHFSQNFPSGVSNLTALRRLDLSHNRFSGEIPITHLSQLPHLLTLRLESNSFNGSLLCQDCFKNLYDFNVSFNNFSGEVSKSLSWFPPSSFIGNEDLCGKPLQKQCSDNRPIPIKVPLKHKGEKFSGKIMIVILITYVCVGIALAVGICLYYKRKGRKEMKRKGMEVKKRDEYEEMVVFQGCKGFKAEDLLKGSAELLGKGSVGSTYKVLMESGDLVVVKRVTRERKKKKEMEGLLREIGGLRNKNVVCFRGYYCSTDELLLVYDFLPNGSLHSLLHGNQWMVRAPLDWTTRLKFASGIAEGLSFVHNNACKAKLSHGHLTSSNVVIDQNGNACLSDVALEQLFLNPTDTNNAYNAPELRVNTHSSRKFSHTSDVYSFGVILLEILTGKVARGEGETSFVKWVQSVGQAEWISEVFDFELLRYKDKEDEMVALLQVALLCLSPAPRDRPKISVVRKMIEDITVGRCNGGRQQPSSLNHQTSDSSSSQSED